MASAVPTADAVSIAKRPKVLLNPPPRERLGPMCSGNAGMAAAIIDLLWKSKVGMTPEGMRMLLLPEKEDTFKEMAEATVLLYNSLSMESEESEGEGSQVGGNFGPPGTVESRSGSQAPPLPPPPQAADAAAADADGPPPPPPAEPSADAAAEAPEADVQMAPSTPKATAATTAVIRSGSPHGPPPPPPGGLDPMPLLGLYCRHRQGCRRQSKKVI